MHLLARLNRWARAYAGRRLKTARYARMIAAQAPALKFSHARLIDTGWDNAVLILDETWVFRIPRSEDSRKKLLKEVRVLNALGDPGDVRIPRYVYLEPSGLIGGYPIVEGREMTRERFEQLDRPAQERAMAALGRFLGALHGLAPGLIGGDAPLPEQADPRFTHCNYPARREMIAGSGNDALLARLDRFFAQWGNSHGLSLRRLVHSDLTADHLLISASGEEIGIIDFSDVTIGDPAWDFSVLTSYGDWVAPFVLQHYAFAAEDPALLDRARRQSVRYWFERLHNGLAGIDAGADIAELSAEIARALDRVAF